MEHHISWLTQLVNRLLGGPVAALLHALGFHPHDPANPISEPFVMSVVVVVLIMGFVLWLKPRLRVDSPGATQQFVEIMFANPTGFGIRDQIDGYIAHHGRKFLPFVATVGIFVLGANLLGIIPVFTSPTADPSIPLACAVVTFLHFNFAGIRAHGVLAYLKHFAGPVWWMSWLIFPVEIISTSARILSLTVRLWANIFSSELIYFTILGLLVTPTMMAWGKHPVLGILVGVFAATLPVAFVLLHVFVAVVQALVFTILPSVYLGLATAEEH
jgi:F-type H+-transporting ATPase subunit a